jgi:hypothetical protein
MFHSVEEDREPTLSMQRPIPTKVVSMVVARGGAGTLNEPVFALLCRVGRRRSDMSDVCRWTEMRGRDGQTFISAGTKSYSTYRQ